MNTKTKVRWYQCNNQDGRIDFHDGSHYPMPPQTPQQRDEVLQKIADIKKPRCKKDGSVMLPKIRFSGKRRGQIDFVCNECQARVMLRRNYGKLTDVELEMRISEVRASNKRRLDVLNELKAERASASIDMGESAK